MAEGCGSRPAVLACRAGDRTGSVPCPFSSRFCGAYCSWCVLPVVRTARCDRHRPGLPSEPSPVRLADRSPSAGTPRHDRAPTRLTPCTSLLNFTLLTERHYCRRGRQFMSADPARLVLSTPGTLPKPMHDVYLSHDRFSPPQANSHRPRTNPRHTREHHHRTTADTDHRPPTTDHRPPTTDRNAPGRQHPTRPSTADNRQQDRTRTPTRPESRPTHR
jgi:hypothetical protein